MAIGAGFVAGDAYRKYKDKRANDLLYKINSYWQNVVRYNYDHSDETKNLEKLNRVAQTNMAQMGRLSMSEIIANPEFYACYMDMFSQSPEDIINYKS